MQVSDGFLGAHQLQRQLDHAFCHSGAPAFAVHSACMFWHAQLCFACAVQQQQKQEFYLLKIVSSRF